MSVNGINTEFLDRDRKVQLYLKCLQTILPNLYTTSDSNAVKLIGVCTDTYVIYQGFFKKLMSWSYELLIYHMMSQKLRHKNDVDVAWRRVFAYTNNLWLSI